MLEVSTRSDAGDTDAVNVIVDGVGVDGGFGSLGIHLHDAEASPGDSTLAPLPWFSEQSFQTGVDVFMPASPTPDGTVTFENHFLGDAGRKQVIRAPNWASTEHLITVTFADYAQD